ncbi:MAG: tryptophan--tRNA ligase [Candidatus Marinimicrobia bacterium]|jgi:tryptophanyl-tRNA synthetase|nr:tryptophan--tRNA ligase [Candidatus Neomarinimicrobiota bacterium]MDD4961235.1 tryptophan--tRNA ligase [Candidatus Neomarinimicrobiota bacterium]MDD5709389.1 tryptophan--tRNA ligase [Candidatus Neomarinimicrobiota bacterium]MDX9777241.1 tryptophan--tRNA ligase [bacterium]
MKKRILSGMRPTGKLHIGHFVGALENWVSLQEHYQNFHLVADYHVLTTSLDTSMMLKNTLDMLKDWIAAGIDPAKSPLFRQSRIKEHTELYLIFSMLISKERLERNPALKEQIRDLNIATTVYGHLGYPVLQAADILLYRADAVPVGEDQSSHIEITREIARKFNSTYAVVFPEPETKLTRFSRLPGLDGKAKMSKSLGNTVYLSDEPEAIWQAVRMAVTDPQKIRRNDPGRPDICTIFTYHNVFNTDEVPQIRRDCESGVLGCVDCKKNCAARISAFFAPHRERRAALTDTMILEILEDGENRARREAAETMERVRTAMKIG